MSPHVRYPVFYAGDRVKMVHNVAGPRSTERFRVMQERWDQDRESLLLHSEWGGPEFWLPATLLARVPEDPDTTSPLFAQRLTRLAYVTAGVMLALVLTFLVA